MDNNNDRNFQIDNIMFELECKKIGNVKYTDIRIVYCIK